MAAMAAMVAMAIRMTMRMTMAASMRVLLVDDERLARAEDAQAAPCTPPRPSPLLAEASAVKTPAPPRKLFIKDGERCWFVALHDIVLFESEGNYTRVHFGGEKPLMLRTLTQLEEKLDPLRFFRASRRHIVNVDHVRGVSANAAGGLDLALADGLAADVSRRRAARFKALTSL